MKHNPLPMTLATLLLFYFCPATAETITIPAIQVTDSATKPSTTSGTTINYDQQQIQEQGALSITDFLNKQGITQVESHSSQQNQTAISLRGFGNNASGNTLVLINGIPLTSFTDIGPNLNSFLLDSIQSIEISPGSYGTLYGDQAVGGVVNIVTDIPDNPTTNLEVGGGNLSQKLGQFYVSRSLNSRLKFSIGGLAYDTNHDQLHNFQNNYNLNTHLDYTGDRDSLKLSAYAYQNRIEIPDPEIWRGPPRALSRVDNHSKINGLITNLQNQWYFSDDSKWDSTLSFQGDDTHGVVNVPFESEQQSVLWHNRWTYHQWLNSGFDLQTQSYDLKNPLVDNDVTANVVDIFSQLTLPITNKLQLILGGRYAYQAIDAKPTPTQKLNSTSRVPVNEEGLVWHFNKYWRYYLRRDTNYRFAKADEKVWVTNNVKELKTQTGTSYETGIKWGRDHNSLSIGLYRLDLDNEIAYNPEPSADAPFGKMFNLAPTRRIGADMAGKFELSQRTSLNLETSVVNPYFSAGPFKGNQIPSVSKVNSSASITYAKHQDWSVNFTETYHSPFYATHDDGNDGDQMPRYFLTNININKNWRIFAASLEIDNLFNRHYVRFANDFPGPSGFTEFYPADGITLLFKLKARLS